MTKGEGLVGFLYAIKDLIETFAMLVITGVAVLAFFWLIVQFIGNKIGWWKSGGWGGGKGVNPKNIVAAVVILFVILAVYSLIGLTAAIFGVNSSPSGGLIVR
jgi:hypothetical protein